MIPLANWPTTLPAPLLGRKYTVMPRSSSVRMESRRQRIRRLYTDSLELIDVTWNFTGDDYATFRDFFQEDLEQGTLFFTMETKELTDDPAIIHVYTRDYAFLDATYSFSESDNLFAVQATLQIGLDSESYTEVDITAPLIPDLLLTYESDTCRELFTLSWPYQSGDVVQIASAGGGPWFDYIAVVPDETPDPTGNKTVRINNDFDGSKYFRVIGSNGAPRTQVVHPAASSVSAPIFISLNGADVSSHPLHIIDEGSGIYRPYSRLENSKINPQNFYAEPRTRLNHLYEAPVVYDNRITFAVPEGAELRWTRNGSDPTLEMKWPPNKIDGFDYNTGVSRDDFSGVIKARCFKGGCSSPMTIIIVDKQYPVLKYTHMMGDTGDYGAWCIIASLYHGTLWYPGSGMAGPCEAWCGPPFSTQEVWDCLRPNGLVALMNNLIPDTYSPWFEGGPPRNDGAPYHWVTYNRDVLDGKHFAGFGPFVESGSSFFRFRMQYMTGSRQPAWDNRPRIFENLEVDQGYISTSGMSGVGGSFTDALTKARDWFKALYYEPYTVNPFSEMPSDPDAPIRQWTATSGNKAQQMDFVCTVHDDFALVPPQTTDPVYDPNDPNIPLPPDPEEVTVYGDDFESYADAEDASAVVLNEGTGWNSAWIITTNVIRSGYELWESYADGAVLDSDNNAELAFDDQVFYGGDVGWSGNWVFDAGINIIYSDDFESYEDLVITGVYAIDDLNGGTGWDDTWVIIQWDVSAAGSENWESYADGAADAMTLTGGTGWSAPGWTIASY